MGTSTPRNSRFWNHARKLLLWPRAGYPCFERQGISGGYEENTGHVIVRTFKDKDYAAAPAVLVSNHGPFTWRPSQAAAAHNAVILE
jgi:L-ribulose-5-phosphate 4-epimerase